MQRLSVVLLAAAAVLAACTSNPEYPGKTLIGKYQNVTGALLATTCPRTLPDGGANTDVPDEVAFPQLTLSNTGTVGFVTVPQGTVDPDGGSFVDNVLTTRESAGRFYEFCTCPLQNVTLSETFEAALVSRSQDQALDGGCPPDAGALSGALPAPGTPLPTGGTVQASTLADPPNYATRICGVLHGDVQPDTRPDAGCTCAPCSFDYSLDGRR